MADAAFSYCSRGSQGKITEVVCIPFSKQWKGKDERFLQENERYQGNISSKDVHNKGRNGRDLTETEDIKKWWQEYTEYKNSVGKKKEYNKDLHDPDNHDGVITHLEPDILECEVKWALASLQTNLV